MEGFTVAALMLSGALAMGAEVGLPDDPGLHPFRGRIDAEIQEADRQGLPGILIANKVREGVAKKVPPARIAEVALQLGHHLQRARVLVAKRGRPVVSAGLYRALVDATMAGWEADDVGDLVGKDIPEARTIHALQTATDLGIRGYPRREILRLVRSLGDQDASALPRLPGVLERLRREYALTHVDAVSAVQRGLSVNPDLDGAIKHADAEAGSGQGVGKGNGNNAGKGNSGLGLGIGAGRGANPGRARGKNK